MPSPRKPLPQDPPRVDPNSIYSGPIDTPMMDNIYGPAGTSHMSKGIIRMVPLGRYGTSEEVAKLIVFLLSEDSSFCSGSVFGIDGGVGG